MKVGALDRGSRTGHGSPSFSERPLSTQPALNLPGVSPAFRPVRPPSRLQAYAALCSVSFVCYIAGRLSFGTVQPVLLMVGLGACGWAWLLTRALFDPAPTDARWPRVVAGVIAVMAALSVLTPADSGLSRMVGNAYALTGSAALLLTFIEPINGRRADMSRAEKRFRIVFLAIFACLVAISVLGIQASGAVQGQVSRDDLILSGCAMIGLIGAAGAVWFRLRHPLSRHDRSPVSRSPTAEDTRLAEQVVGLLRDQALAAEPDLRIADVATRLGQPEYRISRCIRSALGFANFNRLVNHHRIERAKHLLADPDQDRPILDVAFDCGFGSVGPFNRAFRDQVGTTPRAFRANARRSFATGDAADGDVSPIAP